MSVPDLADTATMAGAAADKAASTKETKYRQLANSHVFVTVAIETAGTWNHLAVELTQELDRRMTAVTDDRVTQQRQASCSSGCQWLCNGGMRSRSAALLPQNKRRCHFAFTAVSSACWLCAGGLKINK